MSPLRSTVSEKGQITIPKAIRDRLGITAGELLEFDEPHKGEVVVRKVTTRDPVEEVWGILPLGEGTDRFIERLRGEADAD